MKKSILLLIVLLPILASAQDHRYRPDTAAMLVDRFLDIMNVEAMPADSTLQLETTVTTDGSTDTVTIRRWYAKPLMHRVEVWHGSRLQTAFCTNGRDRFRLFKPDLGYWVDITADAFYDRLSGYDFRTPLYGWRSLNAKLTYQGRVEAVGYGNLQSVLVQTPARFDRQYMFEPSGLLAFIHETGEMDTSEYRPYEASRIEMKFFHEYQEVGPMILPRQESFVRHGRVTVMQTDASLIKRDDLLFNIDNRPKRQ